MTRSELIKKIINRLTYKSKKIIKQSIKEILDYMIIALFKKQRIEIRGFGSFVLRYRKSYFGRNPKTGKIIKFKERYFPCFKSSRKLYHYFSKNIGK